MPESMLQENEIASVVAAAVANQPIVDMHTHTYPPAFGTPVANATASSNPENKRRLWSKSWWPD